MARASHWEPCVSWSQLTAPGRAFLTRGMRNTTNFSVDLISCKFADYFFIRVNSNFGLLIMTILLFFFPQMWLHFISLYCLIAPARTSSTMVNKSDESRPLCLIPELR